MNERQVSGSRRTALSGRDWVVCNHAAASRPFGTRLAGSDPQVSPKRSGAPCRATPSGKQIPTAPAVVLQHLHSGASMPSGASTFMDVEGRQEHLSDRLWVVGLRHEPYGRLSAAVGIKPIRYTEVVASSCLQYLADRACRNRASQPVEQSRLSLQPALVWNRR